MKFVPQSFLILAAMFALLPLSALAASHYVDINSTNATPPYTNWSTAATNIQDAVDAAVAGDEVVVTNGVYLAGGRAVYGTLTNRVAMDKRLAVRSVNGPEFTIINGGGTARCVYLTNSASLSGFTLTGGAALGSSLYPTNVESSGGGVWCESATAIVSNCVFTGNEAVDGGGAYQGTLNDCTLNGNSAWAPYDSLGGDPTYAATAGGGAYGCMLNHCTLTYNSASTYFANYYCDTIYGSARGGGAYGCTLNNCTLSGNWSYNEVNSYCYQLTAYNTASGGGAYACALNNCTITNNASWNSYYSGYGDYVTASSTAVGGGASESTLTNCTASGNIAWDQSSSQVSSTIHGGGASGCALSNCVLSGNSATNSYGYGAGGGAYGGTLTHCTVRSNYNGGTAGCALSNCILIRNKGDGAAGCTLANCALAGNSSFGALSSTLNNCTLTGSSLGAVGCRLTNCIAYFNTGGNYDSSSILNYCCTTPLPTNGVGNISTEPELASPSHLSPFSACIGKGNYAAVSGTDIDGEPWANPPSIGCDEYYAGAVTGPLNVAINASYTTVAVGYALAFAGWIEGRTDLSVWSFEDGSVEINQPYTTHSWAMPGDYLVSLWAFNDSYPGGTNATITVHVVTDIHYVAAGSINPVAPYTSWATAATNIQDAIGAAAVPGAQVLVTNGTYAPITANNLPLSVRSINGALFTIIDAGRSNRCASLGAEVSLTGFTLTNGNGNSYGGGVYGGTLNSCRLSGNSAPYGGGASYSTLSNCTLSGNFAAYSGGGAYGGTLNNCTLASNSADNSYASGGGAAGCTLNNCALAANSAFSGGGAFQSTLNNCTLTGNSATNSGAGAAGCTLNNCIAWFNTAPSGANYDPGTTLNFCCTTPPPTTGLGNISSDPQLASSSHLSATSPCRGVGNAAHANGTDIDGEFWGSPPSIGCDEYHAGAVTGPLSVAISTTFTNVATGFRVQFTAFIDGQTSASTWDFGDGSTATNQPYIAHAWTVPGDYVVVLRASNESQPAGVSASVAVRVVAQPVHYVRLDSATPAAPYLSWATAATNFQDAVDAATVAGALVLATNGVYAGGGRADSSGTTDRILVDKPITVQSLNGPQVTFIDGGHSNRCVYLADLASLVGFTLTNGTANQGGGAQCQSVAAVLSNCVVTGNSATGNGGGAFSGTLKHCTLSGNSAYVGGGTYGSTLSDCTLTGNYAQAEGGGASGAMLNNCILTGNAAPNGSGGGAEFCSLDSCMLTGNSASGYGGGANYCTLNNCTLSGNWATNSYTGGAGGGAYGSTMNNCVLNTNLADGAGGGAGSCTLTNCILTGNVAVGAYSSGGGAFWSTLLNCTLTGNSASYLGGGAHSSTLSSCIVTGNSARDSGGGAYDSALNNCTLTGNAAYNGGGAYSSSLYNCIVYFNTAPQGSNHDGCILNYCCSTPPPTNGVGNIASEPQLASLSHLSAASPCRGAGSVDYAHGTDIDGESWANPPSIGCDEYHAGAVTGALAVAIGTASTNVAVGFTVQFTALIEGRTTASSWQFGDGILSTNQPYISHSWAAPGDYAVLLRAFNESQPGGMSATVTVHVVSQPIHYVAAGSSNPLAPYTSWLTAATNIQDAVDAATTAGALVLVSNGTYAAGGRVLFGDTTTNRVVLGKPLSLRSVNGPQFTTISGGGLRCAYVGNGASLSGLTLTGGSAAFGGGLYCESQNVVVSNCALVGNWAADRGGGAFGGTLNNCVLTSNTWGSGAYASILNHCALSNNTSFQGGGAWNCTLNNCALSGNSARGSGSWGAGPWGGGAYGSTLNNCTLGGNSAVNTSDSAGSSAFGGGAAACTLNNCTLSGNFASGPFWPNYDSTYGGGAWNCTLNECTVSGNAAGGNYGYGGGAYGCTLNNCAVMGNSVSGYGYGGGAYGCSLNNCTLVGNGTLGAGSYCTLTNCIAYFNVGGNYDSSCTLTYCCTTPQPTNGLGNISNAPLFVDQVAGNLRLQSNSPCINAGNNQYATAGADSDGNPRVVGGTVDIGAYEFQSPVSQISYAWLQQYGLAINAATDTADPDGDGVDNYHEWLAGTNPTNALSSPTQLTITPCGVPPSGIILTWSTNAVGFTLQSTTNLLSPASWVTNFPTPVVVDAHNMVTNPISGAQRFYRLVH